MTINDQLSRSLFDTRYSGMDYSSYCMLVEQGFEILEKNEGTINTQSSLNELKAIRMALEYRINSLGLVRKAQLLRAFGTR